ncbi:nitroreductase family protein [Chenggangzhangella methanolivorans]|uniref:Putative NAD(P)H nitroreductase n=1 Tax=Chenggangzhangella methanolivorans TaxID=1437009 RepID=A0A9E6R9M3_9HYPH|nr:nitroreductase [Chenggangzhangella methanolivorans]QZO00743.1 nitroreductase [Chenggangzhangella methanolivorans]
MSDTIELLAARRSVPANALSEPGPSDAELEQILTLASRVPDHGKLAPWRFIVIAGEGRAELGRRLAELLRETDPSVSEARLGAQSACFSQSALVVAVVSTAAPHVKIPEWEQELSAGAVCMNLSVAANALGYGAQWLTGWAAYEPRARELIGLAPQERVAGFLHLGTPTERLPDRPRPEIAKITTRWSA